MPSLERAAPALVVLLVLGACATPPAAVAQRSPPRVVWPAAPAEVLDHCQGDAAAGCYQAAQASLALTPPDVRRAEHLFAAACEAELAAACAALDARFQPPSAMQIPTLATRAAPQPASAVVELQCRVSTAGALEGCVVTRSHGSTFGLDQSVSEGIQAAAPQARLVPATLDGVAYETDLRLVYLLRTSDKVETSLSAYPADLSRYTLISNIRR